MKVSIKGILLFLLIPSYLMAGGYGLFTYIYVLPLSIVLVGTIYVFNQRVKFYSLVNKSNHFFFVLAFMGVASILLHASERGYLEVFEIISGLFVIILMGQSIRDERSISQVLKVTKVVVCVLGIHALIQYVSGDRVTGPYSNENRLSTFYVLLSPLYMMEFVRCKRWLNIPVLGLMFLVLGLAESRFCQLSFLVAGFISSLEYISASRVKQRKLMISFYVILAFLAAPILVSFLGSERGVSISEQSSSGGGSLVIRIYFIGEGLRLFYESNFMGVGAGNVRIPNFWSGEIEDTSLHNYLVSLMATYGVIGLFSFLLTYFFMYKNYKSLLRCKDRHGFLLSMKIFMIIFFIASNSPSSLFQFRPFYFIFALYFCILNTYNQERVS